MEFNSKILISKLKFNLQILQAAVNIFHRQVEGKRNIVFIKIIKSYNSANITNIG